MHNMAQLNDTSFLLASDVCWPVKIKLFLLFNLRNRHCFSLRGKLRGASIKTSLQLNATNYSSIGGILRKGMRKDFFKLAVGHVTTF